MARGYTIKISQDLQQVVPPAPAEKAAQASLDRRRIVKVKPATARANGFRFAIRPVVAVRATAGRDQKTPPVLSLTSPPTAAPLLENPLQAARLDTGLQVPRAFERQLAALDGPYVKVVNGNGVTGMAGHISSYLAQRGFPMGRAANAEHFNHRSTVLYFPAGYLHEAWEVAKTIPGFQEMKQTAPVRSQRARITLLIGRDVVPHRDMFNQG
jgi:hypothetical protein